MKSKNLIFLLLTLTLLITTAVIIFKGTSILNKRNSLASKKTANAEISESSQSTESTSSASIQSLTKEQIKTGTVKGKICFPSEAVPALEIFLKNTDNSNLLTIETLVNENSYEFSNVPIGTYEAFAYVKGLYDNGGAYSQAVQCGLETNCKDHTLIQFKVIDSEATNQIDICDWYGVDLPPIK